MADPSGDAETPDEADVGDAELGDAQLVDDDEEALIGAALLGEFDPSGDDQPEGAAEEPEAAGAAEANGDDANRDDGNISEAALAMPVPERKGRSPFVLIMVPLLVLIGLAIGFRTFASEQRSGANAAVDVALADGSPVELCEGTEGELSLEGFSVEQPLVLSSLTLDRAAVSFVAPIEGTADTDVDTDVNADADGDSDADQAMVDVIELDLEKQSAGWCISSWDASTRLASN